MPGLKVCGGGADTSRDSTLGGICMRATRLVLGTAVLAAVLAGAPAFAQSPTIPDGSPQAVAHRPVCGPPAAGAARCDAQVVTDGSAAPLATTTYTNGFAPADLAGAYKYTLPPAGSAWTPNGRKVAIVDAYDNPRAEADLAAYRARFGLPACTTANPS